MTQPRYVEPTGNRRAGWHKEDEGGRTSYTVRLATAWEKFLRAEGIPVFKGVGVRDSRDLPRADWKRVGGRGTYIQVTGTNNATGMFVVEVPPRGALLPQRQMYEERYVVLEGRGSTEVWRNGDSAMSAFEWQPWSLFAIPLNANFRIINSSSSPALLLAVNTAPRTINAFQDLNFVFNCEFNFDARLGGNLEDYWNPNDEIEPQPVRGRAMVTSNILPDIQNAYLPLDNNRGPGFRWVAPNQVGNTMIQGWLAEYPSGRYAKAHAHASGAVLVCCRGEGFSWTWPRVEGGITPWKDGKGDLVKIQEYVPGGLISAAPGPANWFHQHFRGRQRTVPRVQLHRPDARQPGVEPEPRERLRRGGRADPSARRHHRRRQRDPLSPRGPVRAGALRVEAAGARLRLDHAAGGLHRGGRQPRGHVGLELAGRSGVPRGGAGVGPTRTASERSPDGCAPSPATGRGPCSALVETAPAE